MANKYTCSDGSKVTESQINRRYTEAIKEKYTSQSMTCEACYELPFNQAVGSSHVPSRARAKNLGKTELIWDWKCFHPACLKCHHEDESWSSGRYLLHRNIWKKMVFLREHDEEGFIKRMETDYQDVKLNKIRDQIKETLT